MFDQNSDSAPLTSLSILNKSGVIQDFLFNWLHYFPFFTRIKHQLFKNQKAIFWSEDAWPRKYLK